MVKKKTVKKKSKSTDNQNNLTKAYKLKPSQVKFIEGYVKFMGNITKACQYAKITRPTYYEWMQLDNFKEAFNDANEAFNDIAFQKISEWVEKGDKVMLQFWAKHRMNDRFQEKQIVEHSGNVSMDFLNSLSDTYDEIEAKRTSKRGPKKG